MEREGRFSWGMMGKADYSQAAAIVASLPEAIKLALSAPTRDTLCLVFYLLWKSAENSGRWKASAIPSERYLARKIGRSERTVRRCLSILGRLGLLTWIQRKGKFNVWLTNRYELGKATLSVLYARGAKKLQQIHRRTKVADNDLKKGIEDAETTAPSSNSTYSIKSISEAVAKSALRGALLLRETSEKEQAEIASRKAALRKQAESLKVRGM